MDVKITLDGADGFVAQTHQHTHAADPEGNDLLKARAGIKRSAKDTAEKKQNIITANIVGLQENVLARLPTIETIRRDVRRNRPNNHPAVPDINDTRSVYLFGQSASREFPSQINISASQIIFFASQMTFPASQMFFSVIILFPELKLSIILFS